MVLRPAVHAIDGFFDDATCRAIRAAMDAGATEPAEILEEGVAVDASVRRTQSVDVDDATLAEVERRLDGARETIARAFAIELAGREGANFLRYPAGGFYLPHVDRAESEEWPAAARRRVALVVFLNDDFDGGCLHVVEAGETAVPAAGRLVAFDAGLLHEVEPVVRGVRDVVVDWYY